MDAAKPASKDNIGVAVGKVANQYKVAKHFELVITADAFNHHAKRQTKART